MRVCGKLLFSALCIFVCMQAAAQRYAGGSSGMLRDSITNDSVQYTVSTEGCASWLNGFDESYCGIGIQDIESAWTGNGNSPSTIIYTFSKPVYSVSFAFVGTGMSGQEDVPEVFYFESDQGDPQIKVQPGSCQAWHVQSDKLTSPSSTGAFSAIITVSSDTPFTTLKIVTYEDKTHTGGTQVVLVRNSPDLRSGCSTPFTVPPSEKKTPKGKKR